MADKKVDAIVKAASVDVVQLADTRRQATELVKVLEELPCETVAQEQWFSTQRANVGAMLKGLEDERKKLTRPVLDAKAAIDKMFAPATTPLKEAEAVCLQKLRGAAQKRLEAEQAAKALAAEAVAEDRLEDAIVAMAETPEAVRTEGSSAGWKYVAVVVDKSKVAERWKLVDIEGLEEMAASAKRNGLGDPEEPGIEFRRVAVVRRKS